MLQQKAELGKHSTRRSRSHVPVVRLVLAAPCPVLVCAPLPREGDHAQRRGDAGFLAGES